MLRIYLQLNEAELSFFNRIRLELVLLLWLLEWLAFPEAITPALLLPMLATVVPEDAEELYELNPRAVGGQNIF